MLLRDGKLSGGEMMKLQVPLMITVTACVVQLSSATAGDLAGHKEIYRKQRAVCAKRSEIWALDQKYTAALQKLLAQVKAAGDTSAIVSVEAELSSIDSKTGAQRRAWKLNRLLYERSISRSLQSQRDDGRSKENDLRKRLTTCRAEMADIEKKLAKLPKDALRQQGTAHYEFSPAGALQRVTDDKGNVRESAKTDSAGRISSRTFHDGSRKALQQAQQGSRWRGKLRALRREEKQLTSGIEDAGAAGQETEAVVLKSIYMANSRKLLEGNIVTAEQLREGYAKALGTED